MGMQVVNGAPIMCSFGLGPGTLSVLPIARVNSGGQPAATTADHLPFVNIKPFPMCSSQANPVVAAATAAAMGVPTPAACLPMTTNPWTPGAATVKVGGNAALNESSTLVCQYGGQITICFAGQFQHQIP